MNATIDRTIEQVEQLYRSVTGQAAPAANGAHAPIPPEVDANQYVQERLDQLMRLVGQMEPPPKAIDWTPAMSVWEDDEAIYVALDVPGVPREAIEVTVADKVLTVSGARQPAWARPEGDSRVHLSQFPAGAFRRTLVLPPRARVDDMSARSRDGVLEIRIPRAEEAARSRRSIPVS